MWSTAQTIRSNMAAQRSLPQLLISVVSVQLLQLPHVGEFPRCFPEVPANPSREPSNPFQAGAQELKAKKGSREILLRFCLLQANNSWRGESGNIDDHAWLRVDAARCFKMFDHKRGLC